MAATCSTITVSDDLLQLLARNVLLLLAGFLSNDVLDLHAVAVVEKEDTPRRLSIAPSPARLLIVALKIARHIEVDDHSYIRLAYPHTKGNRCHQHWHIVMDEARLGLVALLGGQTRIVRQSANAITLQCLTEIIHAPAALAVNDY